MPALKPRLTIGLTGGIASGKTEVLNRFRRLGAKTISSDDLAHAALRAGHPVFRRVVRHFGTGILRRGRIDRAALGRIVFASPKQRIALERLVHPWVVRQLRAFSKSHRGLIVLDIPLLFEARLTSLVDRVLCVSCRPDQQVARLRRRNGLSRAEALARIRAQWPLDRKARQSDVVIDNSGSKKFLTDEVRRVWADWQKNLR